MLSYGNTKGKWELQEKRKVGLGNGLLLVIFDIRDDVAEVVLHTGVAVLEQSRDAAAAVDDRGMVAVEHASDLRRRQLADGVHQIHRDLPRFRNGLAFLRTAQDGVLDGIEAADGGADQICGGLCLDVGLDVLQCAGGGLHRAGY